MFHFQKIASKVVFVYLVAFATGDATAQRIYSGSTPSELQYPRNSGIDAYGRAVDARSVDRNGYFVDDYGRRLESYGVPGHYHGNGYTTGGYYGGTYPGRIDGYGYSSGIGVSVGAGTSSGGYYSGRFTDGPATGTMLVRPPRTFIGGGVYPSRTVLNNATRGGVVEYTHNGNGYVYSPGSSYQSVISSGPSVFPSTSVVQTSQPPVIIETRPIADSLSTSARQAADQPGRDPLQIKLIYPKSATGPLSYVLNGTVYSIKPGYSQTFDDDRDWSIEFLRAGTRSQPVRYRLNGGVFNFVADDNGWDLKQFQAASSAIPPSPLPPAPAPAPSPDI